MTIVSMFLSKEVVLLTLALCVMTSLACKRVKNNKTPLPGKLLYLGWTHLLEVPSFKRVYPDQGCYIPPYPLNTHINPINDVKGAVLERLLSVEVSV